MKSFIKKPYRWAGIFSVLLSTAVTFTLLDTFILERSMAKVSTPSTAATQTTSTKPTTQTTTGTTSGTNQSASEAYAVVTENSYQDENIKITIETVRKYDTTIHVADIQISDVSYVKTALANDTYGRNIKDTTSTMAEAKNAIFAINGDYYGFRNTGYVLRNGTVYRDTGNNEALVIDKEGNLSVVSESDVSMQSLSDEDAWQVFSFGPGLVEDGEIAVDSSSEVGQSKNSNPRTAIGQVSKLHYIVVVSEGRTSDEAGLSLLQLAEVLKERGCTTAYNLDGGGSSTMYFNGKVINNPTDGRKNGEREVSDIVYFGY